MPHVGPDPRGLWRERQRQPRESSSGAGGGSTSGATGTSGTGGGGGSPPEHEVESSYGAPVATGKYVWIANPASGRIAYIDAVTLQIKLVDAGNGPTFIAPIPDAKDDVAIVLNVLSLDATVLRASGSDLQALSLPVPSSGNGWSVSANGRWAIAWTDARRIKDADPIEGYQDLTVLDLKKGAESATPLSVGYRPVAVGFDAAADRAFAVTQDGISVVALDGAAPAVIKNIALTDKPSGAGTTDVSITPDGSYALVRRDGELNLSVFSLADGTRTDVPLPAQPTDLDLSPDGSTAIAVLRETSQIAIAKIPGILADPASLEIVAIDATVGSTSLAADSPVAFFYTNATPSELLGVMDTSATPKVPRTILLRAPIEAVFPTRDASHALVLHHALSVPGSLYPAAVSLVPVALDLPPKIVGLDAPVISLAIAPAGDRAILAMGDEVKGIYQLALASMPSLKVQKYPLASLPIAAGIVPLAQRGFVAQKHPDGRITFVDLVNGEARTITGFELTTQVVDGSK
jgi:DNA-binding beta-propeller fold protein YncE